MGLYTENTSDVQQAYKVVATHYGNLSEHQTELFRDGFDHAVIVVDGKTAFRFAKNQEYLDKMPIVSAFLREFAPLTPTTVPIPEILNHQGVTYERYEFLPGKPLKQELSSKFSTANLAGVAKVIGSFLTTIHSFPVERAVELGVPRNDPLKDWQDRYEAVKQHVFPVLNDEKRQSIAALFEILLLLLKNNDMPMKVTHFDIKPDHVIVNPDTQEISGIIDFGDMKIGDPAYDFTFFALYPIDLTPFVLQAYTLAKDVTFTQRVQLYQQALAVMDLEHALEVGDKKRSEDLKESLSSNFVTSHLLQ
jgi:aminoglycoside 2''-phosphotransferase